MSERGPTSKTIPDGAYWGRQSSNQVAHMFDGEPIIWETELGIRGSCPVRFVVKDNRIVEGSIESLGPCDGKPLLDGME